MRIVAGEHAAHAILWPAARRLLSDYPDIKVEIGIDNGLTDIVAERYDAGVRMGEQVAKDMIAVRIAPDTHRAVVGAPSYFARRPRPSTPRDLTAHACINLRLQTQGGFYAWEFEHRGRKLTVRVEGPIAFNTPVLTLEAALAGLGLAYLLEDYAREHIAEGRAYPRSGRLVPVSFRLSPVLSCPATAVARVRGVAGRFALSRSRASEVSKLRAGKPVMMR